MTEALDYGFDQSLHLFGIGLVGLESMGAYALGQELLDDQLGLVGGSRIADGDIGAVISESPDDRGAYSARATGDEGNFSCKGLCHGSTPFAKDYLVIATYVCWTRTVKRLI